METGSQSFPPLTFQPAPTYSPQQIMQMTMQPATEALANYAQQKTDLAKAVLQNEMEYQSRSKLLKQQIAEEMAKMASQERISSAHWAALIKGETDRSLTAEKARAEQQQFHDAQSQAFQYQHGLFDKNGDLMARPIPPLPSEDLTTAKGLTDYNARAAGVRDVEMGQRADLLSRNGDFINQAHMWNANRVGDAAGRQAVENKLRDFPPQPIKGTTTLGFGGITLEAQFRSDMGKLLAAGAPYATALQAVAQHNQAFQPLVTAYLDTATTTRDQALNSPHPYLLSLAKQNSINPNLLGDLSTKYGNDPSKLFSSFTGTPQATLQPKPDTAPPAAGTAPAPTAGAPMKGWIPTLWNASGAGPNPPAFTVGSTPVVAPAIEAAGGMIGNAAQDATTFFRNLGRNAFTGAPALPYATVNPVTLFRQAQAALPPPASAPVTADEIAKARAAMAARLVAPTSTATPAPSLAQNTFRLLSIPTTTGEASRFGFPPGVNPGTVLTGITAPPAVPVLANPGDILTFQNN